MTIQGWFATQIYQARLAGKKTAAMAKELLEECYVISDSDVVGHRWCEKHYPAGYTSYESLPHVHMMTSTMVAMSEHILAHANRFAKALEFDMSDRVFYISDCWINIMPTFAAHSFHIHPLSTISGTVYLSMPQGAPAIKFEDPRMERFMAAPPRKARCRPEHQNYVSYPAEPGDIVLFESWLRHEVPPNRSEDDRVSISFNLHWR